MFRPGRVVWAKVEGHEWWPAKVVRRRAVPRDVAEPPGGKAYVRLFIPVIFFTAQGIPGELKSFEDRLDAALAASAHCGNDLKPCCHIIISFICFHVTRNISVISELLLAQDVLGSYLLPGALSLRS